ncbi:MAG: preprotein translocase subunit SecE [Clostridia bacterium]|nr:preprotein translocase subunit SecE [Clostridia bacterium]
MSEVEKNTEVVETKDDKVKEDKKKTSKDRKPGLGSKIKNFFKSNKSEMKKISWYGKAQTAKSTGVVIVVLVAASVLIGLIDLGLSNLLMWIGKLV